jgi:hypothetical protein
MVNEFHGTGGKAQVAKTRTTFRITLKRDVKAFVRSAGQVRFVPGMFLHSGSTLKLMGFHIVMGFQPGKRE